MESINVYADTRTLTELTCVQQFQHHNRICVQLNFLLFIQEKNVLIHSLKNVWFHSLKVHIQYTQVPVHKGAIAA